MKKFTFTALALFFSLTFVSCYSVFYGGTGGTVVDAESTSTPKSGIAYVDVYAYTDEAERNADYDSYKEGSVFSPGASYYGHTSTETDGTFTLSKIVWKSTKPVFGKDADVSVIYLLFYHENYGLTKGSTLIVSDSTSDTVYQELTATRKTTVLDLTFLDVATGNQTTQSVYVKVTVPQTTAASESAEEKIFDATITGSGNISISYPRWQNAERSTLTEPKVKVSYYQSAEESEVKWKACKNPDVNENETDYAFLEDNFFIEKTIPNRESYSLTFYGKGCRFNIPSFSGQYKKAGDESDDGLLVGVKVSAGGKETDGGVVSTQSQATSATNGSEKHGVFSALGSGLWADSIYTGKYTTASVYFTVDGDPASSSISEIRSDVSSYTVQLN